MGANQRIPVDVAQCHAIAMFRVHQKNKVLMHDCLNVQVMNCLEKLAWNHPCRIYFVGEQTINLKWTGFPCRPIQK